MELIKELTGWVDMARMTVSGTEATMHAMRVARAYTGRTKIVKFEGQYHGVHDYALISVTPNDMSELGDDDNPVALAWGRGIPEAVARTVIPARFNEIDVLRRIFERDGDDIAAVIVEPVLGNAQAILPRPGFHEEMRALTREFGALLIFDEVKTGFRLASGGAAEYFGVTPDLATYAKAMGNGYPAAAFGGQREVMSVLPDKVSHGGTYAGNRVAAAAAVATLEDPARHRRARDASTRSGGRSRRALREVISDAAACRTCSPATRRCSGSCSPSRRRTSTATGPTPTTTSTTPWRWACTPAARCPSPTPASPGSSARPTPARTSSTGS